MHHDAGLTPTARDTRSFTFSSRTPFLFARGRQQTFISIARTSRVDPVLQIKGLVTALHAQLASLPSFPCIVSALSIDPASHFLRPGEAFCVACAGAFCFADNGLVVALYGLFIGFLEAFTSFQLAFERPFLELG